MAPRYLLFTIVLDNWTDVLAAVKDTAYNEAMIAAKTPEEAPKHPEAFLNAHGSFVLVDWAEKKVLATKAVAAPLGFAFDKEDDQKIWFAAWQPNEFQLLEGSEITKRIGHPLFCHIHTVRTTEQPGRLLVTSSGVDMVAELDSTAPAGEELKWMWLATEHGFPAPDGQPAIDREANYNGVWWSCAKQSTHANSAFEEDAETFLCTLPLKGTIARVNKATGDAQVLRDDVTFPHDLHRREGGTFTVASSPAGQALLLNKDFATEKAVQTRSPWLQHAVVTKDGQFVLGLNNRHVTLDLDPEDSIASNSVLQLDLEGNTLRELDVGPENRLYEIAEVTEEQAKYWASEWKDCSDFDVTSWEWRDSDFEMGVVHQPSAVDEQDAAWMKEHGVEHSFIEPHGILLKSTNPDLVVSLLPVDRLKALSWQFGLVVMRGFKSLDKDAMVTEAEKFGEILRWGFGPILNVKVNDDPQTSVLSTAHVEMHFDGMFRAVPSHQLFQCAKAPASNSGGQTTFFFNARFLQDMEKQHPGWVDQHKKFRFKHWITAAEYFGGLTAPFDLITRHPHTGAPVMRYHELQKPFSGFENMNTGKQDYKMTYDPRYYDATEDEVTELHNLLQAKMYDEKYLYKHQWQDGDFVLTDNHGMLHGRLAFQDQTGRHLMRIHIM